MATNDGYTPYPIGLTGAQVRTALNNAFNLNTTLGDYVKFTNTTTVPTLAIGIKNGDIWNNFNTGKRYQAYVDAASVLVFFEV